MHFHVLGDERASELTTVGFSDFSLGHVVCEVRYPGAFLIFDRTGAIWHALKGRFPSLSVVLGTPQQSAFKADSYIFSVEAEMARITCGDPRTIDIDEFQGNCSFFFPLVLRTLDVGTLSRVGLRQFLLKKFRTEEEGRYFLRRLNRAGTYIPKWVDDKEPRVESLIHWQSEHSVVMIRIGMQPGMTSLPGPDLLIEDRENKSVVFLDLDYYKRGDILVEQWDAQEWISQTNHAAKKDTTHLLEEWQ